MVVKLKVRSVGTKLYAILETIFFFSFSIMSISFIWVIYLNPMFRNIDDGIKFCIYLGVVIVFIISDFVGISLNKSTYTDYLLFRLCRFWITDFYDESHVWIGYLFKKIFDKR